MEEVHGVTTELSNTTITREEAEALLFQECRMLDDLRYEEWLTLFTEDGLYWLPIVDGEPEGAPKLISILFDDAQRRSERVYRTLHTPVLDQAPRSRTVHMVTNVEVFESESGPRVLCNLLVTELRPGGPQQAGLNETRILPARCEYRLRRVDGDWRITLKKVLLLEADQPLYNLAFLI